MYSAHTAMYLASIENTIVIYSLVTIYFSLLLFKNSDRTFKMQYIIISRYFHHTSYCDLFPHTFAPLKNTRL